MSAEESMYDHWKEAVQKFDYYVVGIVGTGLILLLRDLKIESIGFHSDFIRALGIFALLVSFIAGMLRLEKFHMLMRFEHEKLKRSRYRDAVKAGNSDIVRESTEIEALEKKLDSNHIVLQEALTGLGRTMNRAYSVRNWALLTGLLLLFFGAFAPLPSPSVTQATPPPQLVLPSALPSPIPVSETPTVHAGEPPQE
jgi:hypothetical protein